MAPLLHGFALALGLILPLGAQNVFVFNQGASQEHFKRVIPAILTAALCDTFLILLAVFGVTVVILTVPILQTTFFAIGLFFLIYMGWSVWKSGTAEMNGRTGTLPPKKQVLFAMSVSLLNPHAILDTVGVIGTSSLNYTGSKKAVFTFACIAVSWLWFMGLAGAGRLLGSLDSEGKFLKLLNKVSAVIIWSAAFYIALQLSDLLR